MSMDARPINVIALDEPAIGYLASPKFMHSAHSCPLCGGQLWLRVRHKSRAIIGVTCEECSYIHTYQRMPELPPSDDIIDLPGMHYEPDPNADPPNGAAAP